MFAAVFAVSMLLGDRPVAAHMAFSPASFAQGKALWTPLTALLLEPVGYGALAVTLLVQWICGSPLAGYWNTWRYLLMIVSAGVLGYVFTGLVALAVPSVATAPVMSGALPMNLAAVVAFGVVFANTPYQPFGSTPIRGRVVAPIFGLLLLSGPLVLGAPWPSLLPALFGALVALAFVFQPWRGSGKSGKVGPSNKRRKGKGGKKSHLKLVHDADDLLN